ncbi:MAG: hypothetical protein K5705_09095 [Oscillospiraceae bacterium]|nr:hypothetical protein [Oscillospiraceae bacterium]
MKKLFVLLCAVAGCCAFGSLQNSEPQTVSAPQKVASNYKFNVPSPGEAGSRLARIADDLREFFALFSVEKLPDSGTDSQGEMWIVVTVQD